MRIGFDLRPVIKKNSRHRGIGKYSYQLIKSLLRANTRHDYVLYTIVGQCPDLSGSYERRDLFYLARPSRLSWVPDLFFLPRRIRRERPLLLSFRNFLRERGHPSEAKAWREIYPSPVACTVS